MLRYRFNKEAGEFGIFIKLKVCSEIFLEFINLHYLTLLIFQVILLKGPYTHYFY